MDRVWSRRAVLAMLATTAGCSSQRDPTPPSETATAMATETRTPTETSPTTETPSLPEESTPTGTPVDVRDWPDGYYQGPLVSAHEHMHGPDGFWITHETMDWFVRWMSRNRVAQVMAICGGQDKPKVRQHDHRLVPGLFAWSEVRNHLDDLASTLAARLDANPMFEVLGEFSLYSAPGPDGEPPLPANHPAMLDVYDLAAERDLPVMVHPGSHHNSYDDPAQAVHDIEAAFEHNRETTFLIHGDTFRGVPLDGKTDLRPGEAIATLFERHPNFYFDISGISPYAYPSDLQFDDEHHTVNPDEKKSREWFESKMAETGVEYHATRYYERYREILRHHSDRVLWGMDASWQWHFNDWVLDTWIDVGRALLGQLPPANARNVGYRTAEELFNIDVDDGD